MNVDDIGRMQDVDEIDDMDDGTANDGRVKRKGFGEFFLANKLGSTRGWFFQTHWMVRSAQLFWITNPSPGFGIVFSLEIKVLPHQLRFDKQAWFLNNLENTGYPCVKQDIESELMGSTLASPIPRRQWVQNSS